MKLAVLLPLSSRGSSPAACVHSVCDNVLRSLRHPTPKESSAAAGDVEVFAGIDWDDALLEEPNLGSLQDAFGQSGIQLHITVFNEAELYANRLIALQRARNFAQAGVGSSSSSGSGSGSRSSFAATIDSMPTVPICWMWGCLATAAAAGDCDTMVLLGDDTAVRPAGAWPHLVTGMLPWDHGHDAMLYVRLATPLTNVTFPTGAVAVFVVQLQA